MKPALCARCGKGLGRQVPDDAPGLTCYDCDKARGFLNRPSGPLLSVAKEAAQH